MRMSLLLMGVTAMAGQASAQLLVGHTSGPVIVTDFDQDGLDDILIIDQETGNAHSWKGMARYPFLAARRKSAISLKRIIDKPLSHDGFLYVPSLSSSNTLIKIDVYRFDTLGHAILEDTLLIGQQSLVGSIETACIAPLQVDVDQDGKRDVALVWTEDDGSRTTTFTTWVSRGLILPIVQLPHFRDVPDQYVVANLHPAASLIGGDNEFLIVLNAVKDDLHGGFGYFLMRSGMELGMGRWFPGIPRLVNGSFEYEATAYGRFSPTPTLGRPLIKTAFTGSFLHQFDSNEPFVNNFGVRFGTKPSGFHLADAVNDYDGDGFEEMVWIDPLDSTHEYVLIADPGYPRSYIQLFDLSNSIFEHRVIGGTSADVNGDGRPDLILSAEIQDEHTESFLFLLLNRNRPAGEQPFVRIF